MSKQIKFKKTDEDLVITIPVGLLKWASENNPNFPVLVKNEQEFAQKVLFELEHNLGSDETGLTGFQILLDKAVEKVATNGEDCIEIIEDVYMKTEEQLG